MYARVDKYTAEEKQNTESRIGLIKRKKNARKMQKKIRNKRSKTGTLVNGWQECKLIANAVK